MRGRPITNKSNYFSRQHYGTLVMLANQVLDYFRYDWFRGNLDINELINVGWFRQARYWPDISKHILDTKKEMFKWAFKERENYLPLLDNKCEIFRQTKEFRRNWEKWENRKST